MNEVHQCPNCQRVRKFGEWITPPTELIYEINSGERPVREVVCETRPKQTIKKDTDYRP